MGTCTSTEDEKNSKDIDRTLYKARDKMKREIKILLLG